MRLYSLRHILILAYNVLLWQSFIVSGNDCSRLHAVALLELCCLGQQNQVSLSKQEAIMNGLLSLLRSLNFEMQLMCLNIVHALVISQTFQAKDWMQPLHLLKSYSSSSTLRKYKYMVGLYL
jgi:hypothetical protein